jgi:hypothetical protein
MLLNGIICEMDLRFKGVNIKVISGCSNIPFLIPVCSCDSIQVSYNHVMPDIKFSFIVKERLIDILLNDESIILVTIICRFALCFRSLFDYSIEFIQLINNRNSTSLV